MTDGWTPDEWEQMARAAAEALPLMEYGSTRAIHDVARLLRLAYQRGRADAAAPAHREPERDVPPEEA